MTEVVNYILKMKEWLKGADININKKIHSTTVDTITNLMVSILDNWLEQKEYDISEITKILYTDECEHDYICDFYGHDDVNDLSKSEVEYLQRYKAIWREHLPYDDNDGYTIYPKKII